MLTPLENKKDQGYSRISWDSAYDKVVQAIQKIQAQYGKDSFAVLSGVSLSNEKSYLMGKFARVALQTANIDYNGRLCMVSAGTGNKKAFGVDRAANSWADILETASDSEDTGLEYQVERHSGTCFREKDCVG